MTASQMIDALRLLTPSALLNLEKVRIGNAKRDGGYVMADRFFPDQKVYSYGISTEVSFDLAMAEMGAKLFMYDHTIDHLVADHPNFSYFKEGVAATDQPEASLFTIDHHIARNGHADEHDMILKMDVEGAEWDVLDTISVETLCRFSQIVMEIHGLWRFTQDDYRERFVRAMTKLTDHFYLFHVHANNASPVRTVYGVQVVGLLEVSLIRKDLAEVGPWKTVVPTPLDFPNTRVARPDHVLSFFPFLPTELSPAELADAIMQATQQANLDLGKDPESGREWGADNTPSKKQLRTVLSKLYGNRPELKQDDQRAAAILVTRIETRSPERHFDKDLALEFIAEFKNGK